MTKKLYVLGDSFSTPYCCVKPEDSFWGLAAKELEVDEIYSYCWPGNCLDNIFHILLNEEFDFENGYFIVGIPPLSRTSIYTEVNAVIPDCDNRILYKFNNLFQKSQIHPESIINVGTWEFEKSFGADKQFISYFEGEWLDVLSLNKIYLISSWLLSMSANFMVVNLTKPFHYQDLWPAGRKIMEKVSKLDNCVIFENTFQSLNYNDGIKPVDFDSYSWNGHHGKEGNHNWYSKIINPLMAKLGWI